jgi:uncharacterized protein YbbK (DUF523 family)
VTAHDDSAAPLRLGISACLLGERVRWDGGHKRDAFLADVLGPRVTWVPVCPEMAIGLGAPREPVELVDDAGRVRLVGVTSRRDHTDAMQRWARAHLDELQRLRLHGFVLKSASPSCGISDVKLRRAGRVVGTGATGLFAREVIARFAQLPVTDESRLVDAAARDEFLRRVAEFARLDSSPRV